MATATVNVASRFPEGISVSAYTRGSQAITQNGPSGTAVATATVAADSVTFTGLTEDERYVAYGLVGSEWRKQGFTVNNEIDPVFYRGVEIATKAMLDDISPTPDLSEYASADDLTSETASRIAGDSGLQDQIDALDASSGGIGVSVTDYGAVGDGVTNDRAAIASAIAALDSNFPGVLYFPPGEYLVTPTGAGAIFTVPAGTQVLGAGRDSTIIKCGTPIDGGNVRLFVGAGRCEFRNLTLKGYSDMGAADYNVTGVLCSGSAESEMVADNVAFRRLSYGLLANPDASYNHTLRARNCLFDGESIGLASGENAKPCMGIHAAGRHYVYLTDCHFTRLGSNETTGSNHSHCIYIYDEACLDVENCVFDQHIDGRYIQCYGTATGPAITNGFYRIKGSRFGDQQVANRAVHTSIGWTTVIEDCFFDIAGSQGTIDFRGAHSEIRDCVFLGTGSGGNYNHFQIDENTGELPDGAIVKATGCYFGGDVADMAMLNNIDNARIEFEGCEFASSTADCFDVQGGTGHELQFRDCRFNVATTGIRISGGTVSKMGLRDCIVSGGTRALQIDSGTSIDSLVLRNNEFRDQSSAIILESGVLFDTNSRDNIGLGDSALADISLQSVGASAESSDTTSLVVPLPGTYVEGDLLVIAIAKWSAATTDHTLPSGWTSLSNASVASTGGIAMFYKFATDSESSVTVAFPSGANVRIGQMAAFSNVSKTDPINVTGTTVGNASAEDIGPITGITTTVDKAAVICAGLRRVNWTSVATLSGDLTWAEIAEAQTTTGGDVALVWDWGVMTTAGAVSAKTFDVTGGTDEGMGVMHALAPREAI